MTCNFYIKITSICCLIFACSYTISAQTIDDFSLESIDNELISLDELKGEQLTVIDFWATWCKPCTKAMPKLNDIYRKYQEDGVSMVGISCDGPRTISKVGLVSQSLGVEYHILKDIDCEVMNNYDFQAFPTLLILNADNDIVWVHEGFVSGDESLIEEAIASRLK